MHGCNQVRSYWSGRRARIACRWPLEMSIRTEVCQILGKDSPNSLYWKKNFPRDLCGLGGDWQKFKRPRDQIMYGLKYGAKLVKPLRSEKNKHWKTRGHNSTMLDRLRGVYFIDPDDEECKETLKHCEEKIGKAYGRGHVVQKRRFILAPGSW